MNTIVLPSLPCGRLSALIAPSSILPALFDQLALLACRGPLSVLDAGNSFQGYHLARALARLEGGSLRPALQRVRLSRVFTCYQMATLLEETPLAGQPVLVLDLLATFYDQGVPASDRRRLLQGCLRRLQAISREAAVAVWVRQRSVIPADGLAFVEMVERASGQVWHMEARPGGAPAAPARQLSLFPASPTTTPPLL